MQISIKTSNSTKISSKISRPQDLNEYLGPQDLGPQRYQDLNQGLDISTFKQNLDLQTRPQELKTSRPPDLQTSTKDLDFNQNLKTSRPQDSRPQPKTSTVTNTSTFEQNLKTSRSQDLEGSTSPSHLKILDLEPLRLRSRPQARPRLQVRSRPSNKTSRPQNHKQDLARRC